VGQGAEDFEGGDAKLVVGTAVILMGVVDVIYNEFGVAFSGSLLTDEDSQPGKEEWVGAPNFFLNMIE
jgi:hypothetical protein